MEPTNQNNNPQSARNRAQPKGRGDNDRQAKINKYKKYMQNRPSAGQKPAGMNTNRGEAMRAGRRQHETATKTIGQYKLAESPPVMPAKLSEADKRLRVVSLGGQNGGGDHNMIVIEYGNDAVVIDSGFNLSVELPGVNFMISDISYLESIKHKVRGYVFTHGHLDHIGATPYVLPRVPAPVYGSQFTCGMVEKQFEEDHFHLDAPFAPQAIPMNMDNHEKLILGCFKIELVRVTHSIPDCSMVVIDTPVGRIINTGDFRLDPEPLDHRPSDVARMKELGKDGVLLLMSESTTTYREGRTPTEHSLQPSFIDIMKSAPGRVFFAQFSSNINRMQMIINASVEHGRKVAIAGRSMIAHVELSVRLGNIKIPKGALVPIREMVNLPPDQVVVVCTGGQGEQNAALQRMSIGDHQHIKLREGDTVVVCSTPIPGNEVSYELIGDDLTRRGVRLFRAPTHDIDGCGPLHVSGHASRDEFKETIEMFRPRYFMPIYGGPRNRKYHVELAQEVGMSKDQCFSRENGEALEFDETGKVYTDTLVPVASVLIDNVGMVVPGVVVKDRIVMQEDGIVSVIITVDRRTGRLLSSPDIITRGFIYIRDNEAIMNGLRDVVKRLLATRFATQDLDQFKQDMKDNIVHYLYDNTRRSPMVIPVVNAIGGGGQPAQQGAGARKPFRQPVADAAHD